MTTESPAARQPLDPAALPETTIEFLTERHLATLSTLRADLSVHVVPVGFTFDQETGLVRIITRDGSVKVRNAERVLPGGIPTRGAVSQVDRGRWLTLEGPIRVSRVPEEIRDAENRYAARYRQPQPNPARVVLVIEVDRILGRG
ncbi:PPOX class F420-dependent enzyme [Nakamurella silvestris]|nr:PPOX class F420-dependent enzyme [Nakamurella silvestris]